MRFPHSITVTEVIGEDSEGNERTRVTEHKAAHVMVSKSAKNTTTGFDPSDKTLEAIEPYGYGDWWSVKEGDRIITPDGEFSVRSATPMRRLRSGELLFVEVICG